MMTSPYWLGVLTLPAALVILAYTTAAYMAICRARGKPRELSFRLIIRLTDAREVVPDAPR